MRPLSLALLLTAALPAALPAQTPATPGAPAAAPATAAGTAPSPAASPATAATLPATAIGRLGQALLDAVNGGDSAAIFTFVDERLGHDVRGRSPATLKGMLVKLHAQSGGLRVERARMVGSTLRLMTQALNGRRWLGIEIDPAPGDSTRASIMLYPTDDPGIRRPPAPLATGAMTDAEIAALIRERVKAAADSDRFSGVVLVAHGDDVLVHEVYGFANRAAGVANTRDTRFPTYSLGKMFTGVAIAQLVAQGKLRWEDTVAQVLPEYPNAEAARRITIAQLLTHTAGVPEPFMSARFSRASDSASHGELLATFADGPLNANSGKHFEYTNGNYATLAAIVERVSGLAFTDYLRRHVWGPAGMQVPATPTAIGYAQFTDTDPLGIEARRPSTTKPQPATVRALGFGGSAYMAEDLFRFARALRTGKLLPGSFADSAAAGRVTMGGTMRYGYGFYSREMHGAHIVGHSGSNPSTGYDSDLQMVWEGDWTVVVLSNYDAPAGMMLEMPILDLLARQVALRKH